MSTAELTTESGDREMNGAGLFLLSQLNHTTRSHGRSITMITFTKLGMTVAALALAVGAMQAKG